MSRITWFRFAVHQPLFVFLLTGLFLLAAGSSHLRICPSRRFPTSPIFR